MNGPGVAFAEQVRFVTVAGEITTAGFVVLGRRAMRAELVHDRRDVTEASRHLGEVAGRWAAMAPDAVGLLSLADGVRDDLLGSGDLAPLTQLLGVGPLREVALGLVTALRAGVAELRDLLSPTADRPFDLALAGIDVQFEAAQHVLDRAVTAATPAGWRSVPGAPSSAGDGGTRIAGDAGTRVAELARTILTGERKDFSSPLGVSKSGLSNH